MKARGFERDLYRNLDWVEEDKLKRIVWLLSKPLITSFFFVFFFMRMGQFMTFQN